MTDDIRLIPAIDDTDRPRKKRPRGTAYLVSCDYVAPHSMLVTADMVPPFDGDSTLTIKVINGSPDKVADEQVRSDAFSRIGYDLTEEPRLRCL